MSGNGPTGEGIAAPTNQWNTALYDDRHSFVWKYGAEVLELLAPQSGERILDLGCGTGHLTSAIAASGAEVIGFDAAMTMVEQARALYPAISFVQADAANFDFGEPFDAVFSNATLHWVTRAGEAASCIAAALRPGGRFVAELGGRGNTKAVLAAISGARQAAGFSSGIERSPWYYPSVAEYAALLEERGLAVTSARLFDRPTPLEP
ncbi:MAG: class I SAM-dependent methyltransferase, partial [Chloroflexi bacterium]|nr:class I SAM-dependent methyltransferase [Chloroflexota bacterium]